MRLSLLSRGGRTRSGDFNDGEQSMIDVLVNLYILGISTRQTVVPHVEIM